MKNGLPKKSERMENAELARQQKNYLSKQNRIRQKNAMLQGGGANGTQDRGAQHSMASRTLNPYFNTNFFAKWGELTALYFTDWAAKKIIDIPVEDALRKQFQLTGISKDDAKALMNIFEQLKGDKQFKRAMKQERLLGGSVIYMCVADNAKTVEQPVDLKMLRSQRDLRALNVVDIQKIWQSKYITDVFSPDYDKPQQLTINGSIVDHSRIICFDGEPLFNRNTANIYQPQRVNPSGFGESILTPLYDLLIRVNGTQEGAYHLVNMASVLLAKVDDLKTLVAGNAGAMEKLQQVVEQISLYRAAIMDGQGVEITQHSASLGSVPELVMTFLIILSAGSDIPATRFLGQAPGGLNATGESDLENYYNVIDSIQRLKIKPKLLQFFEIAGTCLWSFEGWKQRAEAFDIEFPPLHNLDEKEQAELNKSIVETYAGLYSDGLLTMEQTLKELEARKIFVTEIDIEKIVAEQEQKAQDELLDGQAELEKLKQETEK